MVCPLYRGCPLLRGSNRIILLGRDKFGDLVLSFVERYLIQCPFLGGSSLRGSTVYRPFHVLRKNQFDQRKCLSSYFIKSYCVIYLILISVKINMSDVQHHSIIWCTLHVFRKYSLITSLSCIVKFMLGLLEKHSVKYTEQFSLLKLMFSCGSGKCSSHVLMIFMISMHVSDCIQYFLAIRLSIIMNS